MVRKEKPPERNKNNYAIAYYRYSSAGQRAVSIEKQQEKVRQYAKDHGYEIIAEYVDRAQSGLTSDRAEYQRMLGEVPKLRPTVLLVYKFDRLGRELHELTRVEYDMRMNGCFIEQTDGMNVDPADPNAPIMIGVNAGQAEAYSRQIAGNIRAGVELNARRCMFNGHKVYGYGVDEDRHYAIDPETSPYVIKMFTDYANGKPLREIADELNAMGLRTNRDNKWTHNGLRSILKNRAYVGEYHNGDYIIQDGVPRLISDELFEKVQKRFAVNKRRGSQTRGQEDAPRYWLTGKLYCGHCGKPLSGTHGRSARSKDENGNPRRYYYYQCKKPCTLKPRKKERIESAVLYVLKELVRESGNIASLAVDALAQYEATHPADTAALDALVAKRKELEKSAQNVLRAIQRASASMQEAALDALLDNLNTIEEQKGQIERTIELEEMRLAQSDDEHTITAYFERYANSDVNDPLIRDMLLDYFVERIYVYDDYLTVLTWYSTGKKEIEFWLDDGMPVMIPREWSGEDPPLAMSSRTSHLAPPRILCADLGTFPKSAHF